METIVFRNSVSEEHSQWPAFKNILQTKTLGRDGICEMYFTAGFDINASTRAHRLLVCIDCMLPSSPA